MSAKEELYYLQAIYNRLQKLRIICANHELLLSIGREALADEIDWLDCYIYKLRKAVEPTDEQLAIYHGDIDGEGA